MKKTSEKKAFKDDNRKTNPALHLFLVKNACRNLAVIDRCTRMMVDRAALSLMEPIVALEKERMRLVQEDAAYSDADEILSSIRNA